MIILKANTSMSEDNIKEEEKKLSERLGDKVIIIPFRFDIVQIDS